MKNAKEISAILISIFLLNEVSEHKNKDIAKLCEYGFRRCFEMNTRIMLLSTEGQSYPSMKEQVKVHLAKHTKYEKEMGESL